LLIKIAVSVWTADTAAATANVIHSGRQAGRQAGRQTDIETMAVALSLIDDVIYRNVGRPALLSFLAARE
jgi:hypothetical protein